MGSSYQILSFQAAAGRSNWRRQLSTTPCTSQTPKCLLSGRGIQAPPLSPEGPVALVLRRLSSSPAPGAAPIALFSASQYSWVTRYSRFNHPHLLRLSPRITASAAQTTRAAAPPTNLSLPLHTAPHCRASPRGHVQTWTAQKSRVTNRWLFSSRTGESCHTSRHSIG